MSDYQQWGQQPGQPPQGQQWGQPPGGMAPMPGGMYAPPTDKEKQWALFAHVSPLVGLGFIGPLIFMLIDLDGKPSAFVKHHAKQALIWHCAVLVLTILTCGVGVIAIIWHILAALEANKGVWYVYPGCGSFVDQGVPVAPG
jgi:uncharacterized Tic20 family protein